MVVGELKIGVLRMCNCLFTVKRREKLFIREDSS